MTATVIDRPPVEERSSALRASERRLHQETWAASRAHVQRDEKLLMATHFAEHDFLLQPATNPATADRENTASILVNQGTGPNIVVDASLTWIKENAGQGPFHITWYSPGALVPATLFDFRQENPDLSVSTHVHLLPGTVDLQLQAQIGIEAQEYVRKLTRQFSYMLLSGHSFDLITGDVKFHFDREIQIQRACALLKATEKYLFFDSKKFSGEGEVGYSLRDLLATSHSVVVYTVTSDRNDEITAAFDGLAAALFTKDPALAESGRPKSLRLTIVGREGSSSRSFVHDGWLKK